MSIDDNKNTNINTSPNPLGHSTPGVSEEVHQHTIDNITTDININIDITTTCSKSCSAATIISPVRCSSMHALSTTCEDWLDDDR